MDAPGLSVDDAPGHARFEMWRAAIFDTLAISAQPLPDQTGQFRAHFSARASGPLLKIAASTPTVSTPRARPVKLPIGSGTAIALYRESSASVRFRIAGQKMVTASGDLLVADALFEAWPTDRYSDESWPHAAEEDDRSAFAGTRAAAADAAVRT